IKTSGADPEDGDRATILRPAGDIIADRDRTFLPVGDCPHALWLDTPRGQIITRRLRTTRAERDVVLTRAAFVGMTLDGELTILAVIRQPLRLLVECRARLRRKLGRVGFEKYAVADVDDEILLAPGRRLAGGIRLCVFARSSAGRDRQTRNKDRCEPGSVQHLPNVSHPGPLLHTCRHQCVLGLTGRSLNERSINLDGTLPGPIKSLAVP